MLNVELNTRVNILDIDAKFIIQNLAFIIHQKVSRSLLFLTIAMASSTVSTIV